MCASSSQNIDIEAISLSDEAVFLSSGERVPITNWFDCLGDECSCYTAVAAVAGPDREGRWFSFALDAFEPATLH